MARLSLAQAIQKDGRRVPPAGPPRGPSSGEPLEPSISLRQRDVLERVALGETNREIGAALGIAEGTVKRHVSDLLQATGLKNRRQLMRFYDDYESGGSASLESR
jgi:DNA-binding NarL/FixJ family response regulator